jgi:hypothetical protein
MQFQKMNCDGGVWEKAKKKKVPSRMPENKNVKTKGNSTVYGMRVRDESAEAPSTPT